ncbi:MAG: hypothetical protein ACLQNE_44175 [Thermoguttaceae bacterium]
MSASNLASFLLAPTARSILSARFALQNGVFPCKTVEFPFKTVAFARKMECLPLGGNFDGTRVFTYVYEKVGFAGVFVTRGRQKDQIY